MCVCVCRNALYTLYVCVASVCTRCDQFIITLNAVVGISLAYARAFVDDVLRTKIFFNKNIHNISGPRALDYNAHPPASRLTYWTKNARRNARRNANEVPETEYNAWLWYNLACLCDAYVWMAAREFIVKAACSQMRIELSSIQARMTHTWGLAQNLFYSSFFQYFLCED